MKNGLIYLECTEVDYLKGEPLHRPAPSQWNRFGGLGVLGAGTGTEYTCRSYKMRGWLRYPLLARWGDSDSPSCAHSLCR